MTTDCSVEGGLPIPILSWMDDVTLSVHLVHRIFVKYCKKNRISSIVSLLTILAVLICNSHDIFLPIQRILASLTCNDQKWGKDDRS